LFEAKLCQKSVTKQCVKEKTEVDGRSILVVDTPGLYDNSLSLREIQEELVGCINLVAPGPHVFLLVIRIGRFTPEEKETLNNIKKIFGKNSEKFTIVLLTGGDLLEQDGLTVEDYIKHDSEDSFKKLINDCGGRYHVFKNGNLENRAQVRELIRKIDTMVKWHIAFGILENELDPGGSGWVSSSSWMGAMYNPVLRLPLAVFSSEPV
ncbi:hypothetical protein XENOCAPTIV_016560, partial [Xenoophorus captivus]